jgi:hypothetical protein
MWRLIKINNGGEFMDGYHWEQIAMLLLDKIDNMKAHDEEMNNRINELMAENARLRQLLVEKRLGGDE